MDNGMDAKHDKVRIGIFIPRWQKDALEKISERDGRSVSDLIRQQVSAYLRSVTEPGKWTEEKMDPPMMEKK